MTSSARSIAWVAIAAFLPAPVPASHLPVDVVIAGQTSDVSSETPLGPSASTGMSGPRPGGPSALARGADIVVSKVPPLRRSAAGSAFREGRARFTLDVNGTRVPLRVMAISVLPGAPIRIRVVSRGASSAGAADAQPPQVVWTGRAPAGPGPFGLRVLSEELADTIHINVMVLNPASEIRSGRLHGYEIGRYQPRRAGMTEAYAPPPGFAAVSAADEDILASPHFTVGQFLCKQPGTPRFLALSPDLLVKLEALLSAVRDAGYLVPTLAVMSGFRTPAYNRSIGNTTDYSRHLWGDAADVFIDADGNGDMDDLNGDGVSNLADARVLARLVEGLAPDPESGLVPGGLAVYRRNPVHGPFVHVDTRGSRARW